MAERFSILALVLSLCGGCDTSTSIKTANPKSAGQKTQADGKSPSENKQQSARYPAWLEVSVAPDKLTAARQLVETRQRNRLEEILNNPERVFVDSEVLHVLNTHRKTVVERLRAVLGASISRKAHGAATLLFELDEPDGIAFFKRVLKDGSAEERVGILNRLSSVYRKRSKLRDDKSLHELLLPQLDDMDPRILKAAIQVCGILRVPGAAQRFAKLVQRNSTPDRGRLFYWLSVLDPQPEHVAWLARHRRMKDDKKRDHWSFVALTSFARCENKEASRAALKVVRENLLRTQGARQSLRNSDYVQSVQILVSQCDKADVAWLRTLLKEKLPPYILASVMGKLAEFEGPAARTRIIAALDDPKLRVAAAQQIERLYRGTRNETLVGRLERAANGDQRQYARSAVAEALLAIGGQDARQAAVKIAKGLDASSKMRILWKASGWTAESVIDRVVNSGVIDRASYQKALTTIRKNEDGERSGESADLETVFHLAGIGIAFDAETGMFPNRHDLLILDFAKSSRGLFRPIAADEKWLGKDPDDKNGEYLLQFIHGGRLYRARMRNFGDWYDVERIVTTVNIALVESGAKERFVSLSAEGQTARFLFGDPKAFETLSRELHLPLSKDPNQAMRLGREFERKVLEKLEQGR